MLLFNKYLYGGCFSRYFHKLISDVKFPELHYFSFIGTAIFPQVFFWHCCKNSFMSLFSCGYLLLTTSFLIYLFWVRFLCPRAILAPSKWDTQTKVRTSQQCLRKINSWVTYTQKHFNVICVWGIWARYTKYTKSSDFISPSFTNALSLIFVCHSHCLLGKGKSGREKREKQC